MHAATFTRVGVLGSAVLGMGLVAAGCTSGARATSFVHQACHHVEIGLAEYARESPAQSPASNAALDARAVTEISEALPLAAKAAENSGDWNGFMTTLQEINRVPLKYLVPALSAQCGAALGQPVPGATVPGTGATSSPLTRGAPSATVGKP